MGEGWMGREGWVGVGVLGWGEGRVGGEWRMVEGRRDGWEREGWMGEG